jgi:hypothetical protein
MWQMESNIGSARSSMNMSVISSAALLVFWSGILADLLAMNLEIAILSTLSTDQKHYVSSFRFHAPFSRRVSTGP